MPRKGTGLRITRRADTGAITITGTVAGERIRQRAQSNNERLAREEARVLETELLRTAWHGQRRGNRSFAAAVNSYLASKPRSQGTKDLLHRVLLAIGDIRLGEVNQECLNRAARKALKPDAAPATRTRNLITPLRAVMSHAARQGWCDLPHFEIPRAPEGRTHYLLPHEAAALVSAANPALAVLIALVLGTGARVSEALELDWEDVDLTGARAIFWKTKGGKRRNAYLPPSLVALLANLPYREGLVIRRPARRGGYGRPYADRGRQSGGQVKTAWAAAKRRAGIDPRITLHDLRHSWASWHYAVYRDPMKLKIEGGWSSLDQVERYVHLLPEGHQRAISAYWHGVDTAA